MRGASLSRLRVRGPALRCCRNRAYGLRSGCRRRFADDVRSRFLPFEPIANLLRELHQVDCRLRRRTDLDLGPRPTVFYVTGNASDPTLAVLNRLDAESGERTEITAWNCPSPVNLGVIAYASGRVFVA